MGSVAFGVGGARSISSLPSGPASVCSAAIIARAVTANRSASSVSIVSVGL
ncbi:MAG: hypothetical protein K2Q20_06080 [Phycisphaerales bacterium]|nr:hypothetical protein [Phycisphaerales bacterium]